jgi:hypothetical protein
MELVEMKNILIILSHWWKKIQLQQPKKNLDQKNEDKNIIKSKKDIEDIAKHACNYCKTLCFTFQFFFVSKLYFQKTFNDLKNKK